MPEPTRNLLILHSPGFQALGDWLAVRDRIAAQAPDIEVRVEPADAAGTMTAIWQASRPSLVFSPRPLAGYLPLGGTVFSGRPLRKLEQIGRLAEAGVSVPPTWELDPRALPPREALTEFVVVKPNNRGKGVGVRLLHADELAARAPGLMSDQSRMLVQCFVEHAEDGFPTEYRVLVLFGEVLYCAKNRWPVRRATPAEIANSSLPLASNDRSGGQRVRAISYDEDVIALARRAAAAFPDCALLGIDIIRESGSGRLFVMEVNPNGRVWHFSSDLGLSFDAAHRRDLYEQFDALERTAGVLIDRTRAVAA